MTQAQQRDYDLAKKLLDAVCEGPVHSYGSVYSKSGFLMSLTDMHTAVRLLEKVGICVRRTDSGGRPTWELDIP